MAAIRAKPDTVQKIIKAGVCLHNYLKQTDNAEYVPKGFVDCEDCSGNIVPRNWRSIIADDGSALYDLNRVGSNNYTNDAKEIREQFKIYFNSPSSSVPWQLKHVTCRSCGETIW